jgi:pyridoxal phosphate enzyme (YggS family)
MSIAENVAKILADIQTAATAAGRDPKQITLCAATKMNDADRVRQAIAAGIRCCGENKVQELTAKLAENAYEGAQIHFIGHLQRNKVKGIIDKVSLIHSLESIPLAEELQRQAEKRGLTVRVLAEVNIGREESKSGVLPEELREFCLEISKYPNIKLCGFMTMAPKSTSFAEYYDYFKETYNLSIDIWKNTLHNIQEPIISMGMSDSYRAAIAAGATVVRLGSSVFGRTTEDVMKMKNNKNNI